MPRPKKGEKTPGSGRKKGTPNKSTLPLQEIAEKIGCHPFEVLMRFCAGDWKGLGYENECFFAEKADGSVKMGYVITPEMRLKAASEASQYLYAKKKAIEMSTEGAIDIRVVIEDYQSKAKK